MKLPSSEEYVKIIQEKSVGGLNTLRHYHFVLNEDGSPRIYGRSRHAMVFKAEHHSKMYALRFFLNDDPEFFKRYHQIENYLKSKSLSWSVPIRFLDEEYYPVLQMDWVESLSFSEYLDSIIKDPSLISELQSKLVALSKSFEENGIGHGNLNMKHIRIVKQSYDYVLKLIDYDAMFIPELREKDSISSGTAGFQHPMRLSSDFSETVDRFSFWIFLTALEAFKTDPSLWKNARDNSNKEQILFTYRDLAFPQQSATFSLLKQYNNEPLNYYTDKLISYCNSVSLNEIEAPQIFRKKEGVPSYSKPIFAKENLRNDPLTKEKEFAPANVKPEPILVPEQPIATAERTIHREERKTKPDNGFAHLEINALPQQKQTVSMPAKEKKVKPVKTIFLVLIGCLLLGTATYFVWRKQSAKNSDQPIAVEKRSGEKSTLPVQQPIQKEAAFFTSTNITQFLFQLYQSYNKRDLSAILSNYADSLSQYYDAGAVSKSKLSTIIKDLFIKPAYYECHPDLSTLQFNIQGDVCKLTININETIKAKKRSRTENYSSTIEYTVDKSFKILSEKNIE